MSDEDFGHDDCSVCDRAKDPNSVVLLDEQSELAFNRKDVQHLLKLVEGDLRYMRIYRVGDTVKIQKRTELADKLRALLVPESERGPNWPNKREVDNARHDV